MIRNDQRFCDICDEPIARGTTYYTGYTTPDVLRSWFRDVPDLMPPVVEQPDGTVRLEVCAECVAASDMLDEYTEATVDVLH